MNQEVMCLSMKRGDPCGTWPATAGSRDDLIYLFRLCKQCQVVTGMEGHSKRNPDASTSGRDMIAFLLAMLMTH